VRKENRTAGIEVIAQWLQARVSEEEFRNFLGETLEKLCLINTIPQEDLQQTARQEDSTFEIIRDIISCYGLKGRFERKPISAGIISNPAYTVPPYRREAGVYQGRYNLLFFWDSAQRTAAGRNIALNAHIDTVSPFLDVSRKGDIVYGRGSCDDKSGCLIIAAALRLLSEIQKKYGVAPGGDVSCMFVIDEENGGNGSLSLALDKELRKRYDMMVVLECCDQQIAPANRGALWYKIEIPVKGTPRPVVLALDIIRELEREGAGIKSESDHPLFPQRPVQTSHGIFGPFGEYPSRINGYLELILKSGLSHRGLTRLIKEGLKEYIEIYGDKSRIIDPLTGKARVPNHYKLEQQEKGFLLKIWGSSGHMASILENDNAVTKASFIIQAILKEADDLDLSFPNYRLSDLLVLEGGQGFVPTHSIDQIKARLGKATLQAYENYWQREGQGARQQEVSEQPVLSCEKLHNDAFDGDPGSISVIDAVKCAELAGIRVKKPIRGWIASCDARLFARMNPGMQIITTGPGKLSYAHSDEEQISVLELAKSCVMLTLFLLLHSGAELTA